MSSWVSSLGLGGLLKRSRSDTDALTDQSAPHRKQNSLDLDILPDLEVQSEILTLQDISKISDHLPPRLIGTSWSLAFSTSTHGFSLSTLYRKCQESSSPTLVVIQDTQDCVFGALMSCPIRLCEHFYGTGESFLFTCRPGWRCWKWSGENQLFTRGNVDSLLVGAGDGRFGLYLDSSLYQGRSQSCQTYHNEPLTPSEDFVLKIMECWVFT